MHDGLSCDVSGFVGAVQRCIDETGKDEVAVLNKQILNLAYRAAQFTEVTAEATVRRQLSDAKLLSSITAAYLRRKGITGLSKQQFQDECKKMLGRRVASTRFLRVGWKKAIEALGGSFRGKGDRGLDYLHGGAQKATLIDLLAEITWSVDEPDAKHAEGAENISETATLKALEFVTKDLIEHLDKRLEKRAKEFNS